MEKGAIDDLLLKSMANRMSRKRTNRAKMKRVFAIGFGIIVAIMISGTFQARAMSVSAPMPNGVGLTLKFPLNGVSLGTESAEVHFTALHNRSRMMKVEAPIHGRFVRFRVAQMKYVMRFANPSAKPAIAPPAAQDRVAPGRAQPLYRKASFTFSNMATSSLATTPPAHFRRQDQVIASGATEETSAKHRKPRARKLVSRQTARSARPTAEHRAYAKKLALRYEEMRQDYLQLRVRSPKSAVRAYRKLMDFYALAQKWQRFAY